VNNRFPSPRNGTADDIVDSDGVVDPIDWTAWQRFPNSEIEERCKELDKIAASHIANGSLVILDRIAGSVRIADWWTWAESIGVEIPSQAKSFNVARTEGSIAISVRESFLAMKRYL
jgi:hypothetical protein